MPDNIKYISKIYVGEEYYYIKDTSSVHETAVDSTPVFKDADGKYWNLSKNGQGAITLEEYIYQGPAAQFKRSTVKWGSFNMTLSENNTKATFTAEIDSQGTGNIIKALTGDITYENCSSCTSDATGFTVTSSYVGGTDTYSISIPSFTVANGDTETKTITCTGAQNIPGTNTQETVDLTVTVSLNTTKSYAYAFSTSQDAITAVSPLDGFNFTVADAVKMDEDDEKPFTVISNLNPQEVKVPAKASNVYLYIISAADKDGHMFIMKANKSTVGGATTPSGAIKVGTNDGTVQAYSTGKIYHVFRSTDTFNAGDTVSFKAN